MILHIPFPLVGALLSRICPPVGELLQHSPVTASSVSRQFQLQRCLPHVLAPATSLILVARTSHNLIWGSSQPWSSDTTQNFTAETNSTPLQRNPADEIRTFPFHPHDNDAATFPTSQHAINLGQDVSRIRLALAPAHVRQGLSRLVSLNQQHTKGRKVAEG